VLVGARSPTGRLPISWPVDVGQIPIFYASRPTGRPAHPANHFSSKYIDVPIEPLFPFGHGLSYTTFTYSQLGVDRTKLRQGERVTIEVTISNVGSRAGEENVLLFVHDPVATVSRPMLELRGMARIALEPGEHRIVQFEICADDLVFLGIDLVPRLEPGAIDICVGPNASWDVLLKTAIEVIAP
jgi:beta-glucosidase